MALGSIDIANGEIYLRSNQAFNSSPIAGVGPERHGYNHQSWGRWHIQMLVCELHRLRCRSLVRWQFLTGVVNRVGAKLPVRFKRQSWLACLAIRRYHH
ncbi:MAG: hypothetical protein AUH08_03460 [Verrucomicrobia bacterium 13_2_20CM_54_12]|nr:MAG: hypothetical protein AUH08_03460 [Verrucomicrobia bacterium 13_2_20CM_54_12]